MHAPQTSSPNQTPHADARAAEIRRSILTAGKPAWTGIGVTAVAPEDGLYLWDWGRLEGDPKVKVLTPKKTTAKFVRAFGKTWARLPEKDRDTLLKHWHQIDNPAGEGRQRPAPHIEFNSFCLPPYLAGACGLGGHTLLFSVRHVEYAKPVALQHTVAHELGHAISYAHGWDERHDCVMGRGGECAACECQAFSYMAHWGFDPLFGHLPAGRTIVDRCWKAQQK